jgi:hypothetical protein
MDNLIEKLLHIDELPSESQTSIKNLQLNLSPAILRCQSLYQSQPCEPLYGTMAQTTCPNGFQRLGISSCTLPCPPNLIEDGLFCVKKPAYTIPTFTTKSECVKEVSRADPDSQEDAVMCEKYGDRFWTARCKNGFYREDGDICMMRCPLGWKNHGQKCEKAGTKV